MMFEDKKLTRAISHLNKLTKEGSLKWTSNNIPNNWYIDNSAERIINPVYDTEHDDKYLRLFKYSYRYYTDEDVYILTTEVKLSFIDNNGNLLWEFPTDRMIYDLYETVRYKLSGFDGFITKLSESNPEPDIISDDDEEEVSDLPF